jgi:hypothetical protein
VNSRRAAFIHFDDDFFSFLDFAKREDSNVLLNQSIDSWIVWIIGDEFRLEEPIARDIYLSIKSGKSTSGLDKGIVPNPSKIKSALPEIKKEATIAALREHLTGTRASSSKIGIWIVKDEKELGNYYEEIANFLKAPETLETPSPSKWKERAIDLWKKAEDNETV